MTLVDYFPEKHFAILQSTVLASTFLYDTKTNYTVRLNEACGPHFITRAVIINQPIASTMRVKDDNLCVIHVYVRSERDLNVI